jgi:dTDP-4-dehydrorhamnose 3,5-epimerase
MNVVEMAIEGVLIFEPRVFGDKRGYFFESYRQDLFEKHVGKVNFIQDNESFSRYGVLRGLHFQKPPHTQGKLVRVIQGSVLDVAVDMRKNSSTYGRHVAERLSEENKRIMWIPPGFAHGFIVLSETALFSYKCNNYYSPAHEAGVTWNDPALGIDWVVPPENIRVSDKDAHLPLFSEVDPLLP